jgi:HEAT repeat protein
VQRLQREALDDPTEVYHIQSLLVTAGRPIRVEKQRCVVDFKPILKLPRREVVPGEETTSSLLEDAVAIFATNPARATGAVRKLQSNDPSGLALAAVRLLAASEQESPGLQHVAGLVIADDRVIDLLLDERVLSLEAAVALARKLAAVEPLLDVRLVRKAGENALGHVGATESATVLRLLSLVDAISDCSRLACYLIQFLSHPAANVRSKAALLLGRANWNPSRVKSLLASEDSRLRANAVESLWGHGHQNVGKILWEAAQDACGRVVVNALLGLCRAGDREAHSQLAKLADSADPLLRCGAAWAMGETGDPEFGAALKKLGKDGDPSVRAMAEKSYRKLGAPDRSHRTAALPPAKSPRQ